MSVSSLSPTVQWRGVTGEISHWRVDWNSSLLALPPNNEGGCWIYGTLIERIRMNCIHSPLTQRDVSPLYIHESTRANEP